MLSCENYPYPLIKKPLSLFKHIVVSLVPFVQGRSFLVSKLALKSIHFFTASSILKVKRIATFVTVIEIIIVSVTCVPLLWSSLLRYHLCLFEIVEIHRAVNQCAHL